jgi:hypothetical protein
LAALILPSLRFPTEVRRARFRLSSVSRSLPLSDRLARKLSLTYQLLADAALLRRSW